MVIFITFRKTSTQTHIMTILDDQIDINLELIFKSENQSLHPSKFVDENGLALKDPQSLIEMMEEKHLIETEHGNDCYFLTEQAYTIMEKGGWLQVIYDHEKPEVITDLRERITHEFEKTILNGENKKATYRKLKIIVFTWLSVLALLAGIYQYNEKQERLKNNTESKTEIFEQIEQEVKTIKEQP